MRRIYDFRITHLEQSGGPAELLGAGDALGSPDKLFNGVRHAGGHGYPLLPTMIRGAIAVAALPLLADGLLPQIEMALFGGHMPIRVNLYVVVSLLLLWMLLCQRIIVTDLTVASLVLISYLLLDAIHLNLDEGIPWIEILRWSISNFAVLLIASFALSLKLGINEKLVVRLILLLFAANLAVQTLQFAHNSPILPEQTLDGSWSVTSDIFVGGQQRAFGLFSNGLDAGLFCAFVGSLGAAYCRNVVGSLLGLPLVIAAAFGCYASRTRVSMVAYVLSLLSVLLLSERFRRLPRKLLPIGWAGVGMLSLITALVRPSRALTLENTESSVMRLQGWVVCYQRFVGGSFWEKLAGAGISPGQNIYYATARVAQAPTKYVPNPIDSTWISISLYFGVLCLPAFLFLAWRAWRDAYERAVAGGSEFQVAVAGFASIFFFIGMFGDRLDVWAPIIFLSALCAR